MLFIISFKKVFVSGSKEPELYTIRSITESIYKSNASSLMTAFLYTSTGIYFLSFSISILSFTLASAALALS